ncbi:hypothetical protein C8R47DRAFT_1329396 [Mycena vitilis]|nr:hypothetical protein C8R47DRAFT_1329396 [Mycena vitilis]
MRYSLHESAAQRSPPPPFPPALDLDHDGQDQEPKEAPSQTQTILMCHQTASSMPSDRTSRWSNYIDDMADKVAEGSGEESRMDVDDLSCNPASLLTLRIENQPADPIVPPPNPFGPTARYPFLPAKSEYGGPDIHYSVRFGGPKIYDLLHTLPMEKYGALAGEVLEREEEIFARDDIPDEHKVMHALWARWISSYRQIINVEPKVHRRLLEDDSYGGGPGCIAVLACEFLVGHDVVLLLEHYERLCTEDADARDYHLDRAIQALNQELSRAPTPALGGRIALPDILSRSPTPLAPYRPQPMPGSRAPTPIFEADSPRAATPLFFPMSEDEDASSRSPTPVERHRWNAHRHPPPNVGASSPQFVFAV